MIGLSRKEAEDRLQKFGLNEIEKKASKTRLEVLKEVVVNPIILVMILAFLLTFLTHFQDGELTESYIILMLIVLNIVISYVQEMKTIVKLKSLDAMNEDHARVFRDGQLETIKAKYLVVGDVIELKLGDIARADAKVLSYNTLAVDEAFLTGESEFVNKVEEDIIYSNSMIQNGHTRCEVIATGMDTEIGKITKQVSEVAEVKSQLEIKILDITKVLLKLAVTLAIIIFVLSMLNGEGLSNSFSFLISILIATVPEGLATVLTIVLTFMAAKMASQNALVKQVNLLETLGEVSYVCSDKTGTITENKMTVVKEHIFDQGHDKMDILKVTIDSESVTTKAITDYLAKTYSESSDVIKVINTIPFNSTKKMSTHLVEENGIRYLVAIGAPDVVAFTADVEEKFNEYASNALRTILFALKPVDSTFELTEEIPTELSPVCLFGIQDPPKQSVVETILEFADAQISPVMITGDSKVTASSIAKQTGILKSETDMVLDHEELVALTDEQLSEIILNIKVYARAKPEDKVRIVRLLQSKGQIVAMMGDGTNDSIALRQANVGIAMGVQGTDISKDAADLILLDDNYQTISHAIHGGRLIFVNLQKFVRQMLTSNTAHTSTIMFALILGLFTDAQLILPMTPILILWINIISDAIPCLALGLDNEEGDLMKQKPIAPDQKILDGKMIGEILLRGCFIGLLVLISFQFTLGQTGDENMARAIGFTVLSFGQLIHIFDARSTTTIYKRNPFGNSMLLLAVGVSAILNLALIYTPLNELFELAILPLNYLFAAIAFSSIPTFTISAIKLLFKK